MDQPIDAVATIAQSPLDQAGGRMAQAYTPGDAGLTPYMATLVLADRAAVAVLAGCGRRWRCWPDGGEPRGPLASK